MTDALATLIGLLAAQSVEDCLREQNTPVPNKQQLPIEPQQAAQ